MSLLKILQARAQQGRQTVAYPDGPVALPSRFRGRPVLQAARCPEGCATCERVCPTEAIGVAEGRGRVVDLGRCLFCGDCAERCPTQALTFSADFRVAARSREALQVQADAPLLASALDEHLRRLFGRSLKLRQVCAAGCSGCEAELNASGNIQFDMGRFGIQFVASPRHADGLVVTGPLSENMRVALLKTWEATPPPRLVIAVGACAISGGPFRGSAAQHDGLGGLLPVDLWVPGCPPHPLTFMDGVLRLLGRLQGGEHPR